MASTQTASVTHLSADLPPTSGATAVRRRDTSHFSRKFSVMLTNSPQHRVGQGVEKPSVPRFLKVFCHFFFRAWAVSFSTDFWLLCVHRYVMSKTKFWTLNKTKLKDEFIFKAYGLENRETQGDRQCFLLLTHCSFLFCFLITT